MQVPWVVIDAGAHGLQHVDGFDSIAGVVGCVFVGSCALAAAADFQVDAADGEEGIRTHKCQIDFFFDCF